jgi:hypothetical protein
MRVQNVFDVQDATQRNVLIVQTREYIAAITDHGFDMSLPELHRTPRVRLKLVAFQN